MKVLMLGWEFPPFFAGGAGMVCKELTGALNDEEVEVTFVMPKGPRNVYSEVNKKTRDEFTIRIADQHTKTTLHPVRSLLGPYMNAEQYAARQETVGESGDGESLYGPDLHTEIYRFADVVVSMFEDEEFDVIHAHDWVTFPAAVALKEATGKPLVTHIHITEYDKSGGLHADPFTYNVEKKGMTKSDLVISVSERVKGRITSHYDQPPEKIRVVHNAAIPMEDGNAAKTYLHELGQKTVLFAGRITLQKGPEYFIEAAREALQHDKNLLFVVAGSGDKLGDMMEQVAHHGLSRYFLFTGFYTRKEAEQLFSMADVFVMPSVSEPFGIVPYEAQAQKTPTIISKQSGISEVLKHTFKADFWDTKRMAQLILCLANYDTMNQEMAQNGHREATTATWREPAKKCINIYNEVI
jgi:glycosyltransferase involved in cell wall biosynthesis